MMLAQYTWMDWSIVAVIIVSTLISLNRGFVKECLSLLIWLLAIALTWLFGARFAGLFQDWIQTPSLRVLAACVLVFLVVMIAGAVLRMVFSRLVEATGLTGTDRVLGMVFGALRGVIIVVIAVGVISLAPVRNDTWWQESRLVPPFAMLAVWSQKNVMTWLAPWFNHA